MIGRPKTPLNIPRQPAIGSTWIIQNIQTGELCKCSMTTQSDKGKVETLRRFSGPEPIFTARIGSKHTQVEYLTFSCGAKYDMCIDESGDWKWIDTTQDEADIKCLWYSEPNLVTQNPQDIEETPELPETTFKPIKDLNKKD
jgi:hypothetical protein